MTNKIIGAVAGLALILSFIGLVGGNQPEQAGGMTNLDGLTVVPVESTDGFKVGTNGTNLKEVQATTCNLSTQQLPLEATSTDVFYCAITGVASGDLVWVTLPSDNGQEGLSTGGGIGFQVTYAKASSTAGYIEVGIGNATGAATSTFTNATTSVQVFIADN